MRRIAILVAVLGLGSVMLASGPDERQTATSLLAEARVALGGDAALSAVRTLTARGELTLTLGDRPMTGSLAYDIVLPDRILRTTRRTMDMGPRGSSIVTDYEGFAADEPIREVVAPGSPIPMILPGPEPRTPEEADAQRARQLLGHKRRLLPLLLALFAASPDAYPLTFSAVGRLDLPDGPADVVEALDNGDGAWLLFLDPETHRLTRVTWMRPPLVAFSVQSTVGVNRATGEVVSRGNPTPTLPADPTAGMADVEWAMTFSDYREVDGLTWPHRIAQTIGGQPYEDSRINRFAINPDIDLEIFDVKR